MRKALAGRPSIDFPKPDAVVATSIDPTTGFLATTQCLEKREEFYLPGTAPTEYCPDHGGEAAKPVPEVPPVPSPDSRRAEAEAATPVEGTPLPQ
jgi:membrane carboxypeptidase/penicillin-binding protein